MTDEEDQTSKNTLSETQKRNDIIGQTSFSLSGLEQTLQSLPLKQQKNLPPTPAEDKTQPAIAQPTLQTSLHLGEAHSSSTFFSSPTQPYAPLASQPHSRIFRRTLLLIVLLFLLIVGTMVYFFSRPPSLTQKLSVSSPPLSPQPAWSSAQGISTSVGRSFQVSSAPLIVLKGYSGSVRIISGNAGSVTVTTNGAGNAHVQYQQAHDGQGHTMLSISTRQASESINYTITVPSTARIEVTIDAGTVSIDGVSAVRVNTNSGSLDIEDVHGTTTASTVSGDITLHNVQGTTAVEAVNGSIRAMNVNGPLQAVTQNGDVTVQQSALSGQSLLKTNYGSLLFAGTLDRQSVDTLETLSGNVELLLPADAAFQLQAHTNSGTLYNEFGSNSISVPPQAQIIVNIGSGSTTISKA